MKFFRGKWFDTFMAVVGIVGAVGGYIQAYKIFMLKSSFAVSLSATLIGLACSLCWLTYGVVREVMPLVVSNIIGILGTLLVVVGIVYYG